MGTWLQSEWQKLGGGALVLLPFTLLFAAAAWARRALYRARILPAWKAPVPVVVVGNVSVGGSGKTPLAIAIAPAATPTTGRPDACASMIEMPNVSLAIAEA